MGWRDILAYISLAATMVAAGAFAFFVFVARLVPADYL
jgi:hypothetical protein